jgi:hypothetical protein
LEDKTEQVLKIIRQWVKEHGYGDLCILIKCHQGEAVGIEDVKDKTKRIVRI